MLVLAKWSAAAPETGICCAKTDACREYKSRITSAGLCPSGKKNQKGICWMRLRITEITYSETNPEIICLLALTRNVVAANSSYFGLWHVNYMNVYLQFVGFNLKVP